MPKDDFKHVFLEEALESLHQIEEGLLELEKDPGSREFINAVFRALHTIKGGAGMVGMEEVGNLSHYMENVLSELRQSGEALQENTLDLLFSGLDLLKQMIETDGDCIAAIQEKLDEIMQSLKEYEMQNISDSSIETESSGASESCEYIKEFDAKMMEEIDDNRKTVYLVNVTLCESCLVKIARVYLVLETLEKMTDIIRLIPSMGELELENFDTSFSVLTVCADSEKEVIAKEVKDIPEVEGVDVSVVSLEETKKFFIHDATLKESETGTGEKKSGNGFNYFRIDLFFKADIMESGIDPLMFLPELHENGRVLASYINNSRLPDLKFIDFNTLYLSWVFFIETTKNPDEMKYLLSFADEDCDINVHDISGELSYWFGSEEAVDYLVEHELIFPTDAGEVLNKQKEIGRMLVKEGRMGPGMVDKAVQAQKQSGEREQFDSIRVSTGKLESILDSVAELIISQSRLKEMAVRLKARDRFLGMEFTSAFEESDKIIRRLQEDVMNASMIPIGGTFIRFQRMARDLAKELGKEIEFKISGRDTELDKKIIEQIIDPLKHLIRNSVGHGIESPEEREAAGKPRKGTINLNAYHQEGNVVIEIKDDGRGIDEEKVLAKAKERNLVDNSQSLSKEEIQQMVFMPGFSTADKLSDVSGRGVGLDVVMNNIQNLSGYIDLYSEKNKGTTFTVRLPLTMAIIDGMMIRVGEERFIIPLSAIMEFIKAGPGDVRQAEGKGMVLRLREDILPFIGLYQLFTVKPDSEKATDGILVILREGAKKIALQVDEIIGQEQVVIKSIKEHMEQVPGVAGATIMGDGRVAVILDITSLFRLARQFTGYNPLKSKIREAKC